MVKLVDSLATMLNDMVALGTIKKNPRQRVRTWNVLNLYLTISDLKVIWTREARYDELNDKQGKTKKKYQNGATTWGPKQREVPRFELHSDKGVS